MARRVFVHIGTPKSGTSYLQSLWWHNAEALAAQGLLLPGGSAEVQFQASAAIRTNLEEKVREAITERRIGTWDRLSEEIGAWDGDALLTQEQLVATSPEDAAAALTRLRSVADEVHVVISARDLVRQFPSAWQQRIKRGSSTTLRKFFTRVAEDDPVFNFWRYQDIPRILERWSPGTPPSHVHVVALPRPGADPGLLWHRTCDLLGIDDTELSLDAPVANESLTPAEVALLRRVNAHFPDRPPRLDAIALSRRVRSLDEMRVGQAPPRIALAPDMHHWLAERGNRMVDELVAAPWHVVGRLDDLRPDPVPGDGVDPDSVPDVEVLAVAQAYIAAELLERETTTGPRPRKAASVEVPPALESSPRSALKRLARRVTQRGTSTQ